MHAIKDNNKSIFCSMSFSYINFHKVLQFDFLNYIYKYIYYNNIENIIKSASKFRETVRSVTPLIILYTILSYIFTPSILRDLQIEQNLDNLMSEMKNHDIFSSLLLVLTFSFYTIFINQFIITNIKKQIFKISDSMSALT